MPDAVIKKAKQYLAELEAGKTDAPRAAAVPADDQVSLLDVAGSALAVELTSLDLNTVTPLEALNLLYKLKKMAEGQ